MPTDPFPIANATPVTVLYLAGAGRSGGTLIGKIFGQHPHLLYAGELRELWTPGLLVDRLCGCGTRLIDCAFWIEVFERAYGGLQHVDAAWMNAMRLKYTRTRHTPAMMLRRGATGGATGQPADLQQFAHTLGRLYHALSDVTGRPIIVDASRSISFAHVLEGIPSLQLRVVHLVRDARAVAFSWLRRKVGTTASRRVELARHSTLRSASEWVAQNLLAEASWRANSTTSCLMRYEDFVADPTAQMRRVLRWLGEPAGDLPFVHDGAVGLGVSHSAAGNLSRLETGRVPLRLDDEWRRAMRARDRAMVNLLAWPLLKRYGYALESHERQSSQ